MDRTPPPYSPGLAGAGTERLVRCSCRTVSSGSPALAGPGARSEPPEAWTSVTSAINSESVPNPRLHHRSVAADRKLGSLRYSCLESSIFALVIPAALQSSCSVSRRADLPMPSGPWTTASCPGAPLLDKSPQERPLIVAVDKVTRVGSHGWLLFHDEYRQSYGGGFHRREPPIFSHCKPLRADYGALPPRLSNSQSSQEASPSATTLGCSL